jgi:diketogulonate reductase-like aldo/keto reductase
MEYRTLGRTAEKVSTIGLGTWKIGSYRDAGERAAQVEAIRHGVELGMNLIDTAEMYSAGRSEEVVGEAIRGIREQVFVATKVSPEHLRSGDVERSCLGSLQRLGIPCIDLYQIHWPNPVVPIRETMKAMQRLVHEGKVRYIGVSNFDVTQTGEASDALASAEVVSNQVEYSLTERSVEQKLLPYCTKEGITVIAYSPLSRGRIPVTVNPEVQEKYKMTAAQVALNWVTRRPGVLAIPKSTNPRHLEENASSVSRRFTEEEYSSI